MKKILILLLPLILFYAFPSFAENYVYKYDTAAQADQACRDYDTNTSACTFASASAPYGGFYLIQENKGVSPVRYMVSCTYAPCDGHYFYYYISGCPVGTTPNAAGQCVDAVSCPSGITENITVPLFDNGGDGTVNITGLPPTFDVNGCQYVADTLVSCGLNACTYSATSSGSVSTQGVELTAGVTVDTNPPQNSDITNNETTDYAPYAPVTNPDGSTTTGGETTTTTTTGSGATVNNGTTSTTVTNSDGSTTTTTVGTETTANPDGSSTTTTTTTTTTTGGGGIETTIPADPNNPITQEDIPPSEGGETTTTTTTDTDADGNETGTETNCTGTDCEPPDEYPAECGADGQEPCAIDWGDPAEINPDGALGSIFVDPSFDSFFDVVDVEQAKLDALDMEFLPELIAVVPLTGGDTCNPNALNNDVRGFSFQLLTSYCVIHDAYIRPALYWLFAGLTLLFVIGKFMNASRGIS